MLTSVYCYLEGGGGGGGGSDVFVWVFVKGHALIHSRKSEGHDLFHRKFLKYPGPLPPIKNVPSLRTCGSCYQSIHDYTPPTPLTQPMNECLADFMKTMLVASAREGALYCRSRLSNEYLSLGKAFFLVQKLSLKSTI